MCSRLEPVQQWFTSRGWRPFDYQVDVWTAYCSGEGGLIHAPTGTGKTYAALMGPVVEWLNSSEAGEASGESVSLRILWITPLRALATDTLETLREPLKALNLPWTVQTRTGDTPASIRSAQKRRLPTILITTPESLSLLFSYPDAHARFRDLRAVVVDEWHELLSTKRGVQTELCLARLRNWHSHLRIWGLSATLGNLKVALKSLQGTGSQTPFRLHRGVFPKTTRIECLIPKNVERFPWAGHMGVSLISHVITSIEESQSALLFTNTRSQTEIWYQEILERRPQWKGQVALHHGSIDRKQRRHVEESLRRGELKCVVCTSSLDLGVDFSPVDQVFQVGSPKGVARLLQRAGRSGHQPAGLSRITLVPTHALELVEAAAVRTAMQESRIEARVPISKPLDVLVQHLVTVAAGGGFRSEALFREITSCFAYRDLTPREWQWALDLVSHGGDTLQTYEEFKKVVLKGDSYSVRDQKVLTRHRVSIGTITSDTAIAVKYLNGRSLGSIEEKFLGKLRKGDRFVFAGKPLEFVHLHDMVAWVRRASTTDGLVPRWSGGRMPLSTELAESVRRKLKEVQEGVLSGDEMAAVKPLLEIQQEWSAVPKEDQLLIERIRTREGFHMLFYPFEGRLVHEGLSSIIAYRFSKLVQISFTISVNDYGFELLSPTAPPLDHGVPRDLFETAHLLEDIRESLNATEMAKQQFREIARIAGLVFRGYPGSTRRARHVQISSGLLYDVFRKYEPDNLLLCQAEREVFERQLEKTRLIKALIRLQSAEILLTQPARLTPFAFPLVVSRMRQRLSSEKLKDRIERLSLQLARAADRVS